VRSLQRIICAALVLCACSSHYVQRITIAPVPTHSIDDARMRVWPGWAAIERDNERKLFAAAYVIGVAKSIESARVRQTEQAIGRASASGPRSPRVGSMVHSDAWWRAISVCEQGGRNDPYFGYFSIMDGSAGGLPWATQVAMAQRIIDRAGDHAWASRCVSEAYAAAPNG